MFGRKQLKFRDFCRESGVGEAPGTRAGLLFGTALASLLLAQGAVAQLPVGAWEDEPDFIEDAIDEQIEDTIDIVVDDVVDDLVDDVVDEVIDEVIDEVVDELVLGPGIIDIEDVIEDQVEDQLEEQLDESVSEIVEESVDETIEDTIEESFEESIEDVIEESVDEQIASNIEEEVETSVEEAVEDAVEESVAANVEDVVEESVEELLEEDVQQAVAQTVETTIEEEIESDVEVVVVDAVEERLDSEIDDILDDLESGLEVDENRIQKTQWLVMAEPEVFDELAEEGYLFATVTDLPALGMRLAEVAGPETFDITEVRRGVLDVVGKDRAEVDLNHLYTAGTQVASTSPGIEPRAAVDMPDVVATEAARIGMIDSLVDTDHPALADSRINSRSFTSPDASLPDAHGTAIASIIAANGDGYQGLMPSAEVYAAAVFEEDPERGEIASTVSLLRALDWLISSEVDVVNISLAGPPNRLLETALKRAHEQDVLVMAAAGNGGPVAQPMYPAAYESVVAVTAVDAGNKVFRLANRGEYLDLAAPGVDLLHARAGGGYAASSGTSYAVPFAVSAAAHLRYSEPGSDALAHLIDSAEDLGPPGRDDIYGHGLLRFDD